VPAQRPGQVYECGSWEIDLSRRELRAHGVPVPMGNRAFDLVEALVRSAGEVVTKSDLMDSVWSGVIVEEGALQVHISAIRKALGSDRGMLKTAFGRGYRLLGDWTSRQESAVTASVAVETVQMPVRSLQTNLPEAAAALIGRSFAIHQLRGLLSAYRMVTLTGPGGIGKTALALETARDFLTDLEATSCLVELASISDPGLVPSAVASALSLKLGGEISPEAVARAIGVLKLLLVLDNCEHVIDSAARLAEAVVHLCPRTTILATSREMLRIEGEYVYAVPPLDVPPHHEEEPDEVLGHGAVQLFVTRTMALRADFAPHRDNLRTIAAICRCLDGIPLAIEFAAARASSLGVREVASRLDDRFALLTGGRRTALPRHQTLRATLDWSYELLPEAEALIFCRLAIFAGPFSLEEAGVVAASSNITAHQVADHIANLVAKSLVTADVGGPVVRYRLLETTRAYALQKLAAQGELQKMARSHAEFYRDFLERVSRSAATEPIGDYRRYIDEVRAALDWAFSLEGDAALGVSLTAIAVPLWFDQSQSLVTEARERIDRALLSLHTVSIPDPRRKMQLLAALGSALIATPMAIGPRMAVVWAEALEIAERLDDVDYQMRAIWGLFVARVAGGRWRDALVLGNRFHAVAAGSRNPEEALLGERMMGVARHMLGDQRKADNHLRQVVDRYVSVDRHSDLIRFQFDQRVAARAFLSRAMWLQGFAGQALRMAEAAVDEALAIDHPPSIFYALHSAACPVSLLAGDLVMAERYINVMRELSLRRERDIWNVLAQSFRGVLLIKQGDVAPGIALLHANLAKNALLFQKTAMMADAAEGFARLGDAAKGLEIIDEALARSERDEERWCVAELLRIKGELVLLYGGSRDTTFAETIFAESIAWAQQQAALSWELRTSISLARLRRDQGRDDEAHTLVASVYRRFTEGFETADLVSAKQFLEEKG
jgi:predicted ATPase/DNA-binding winged helix-turn-helix (wHTH) protein